MVSVAVWCIFPEHPMLSFFPFFSRTRKTHVANTLLHDIIKYHSLLTILALIIEVYTKPCILQAGMNKGFIYSSAFIVKSGKSLLNPLSNGTVCSLENGRVIIAIITELL